MHGDFARHFRAPRWSNKAIVFSHFPKDGGDVFIRCTPRMTSANLRKLSKIFVRWHGTSPSQTSCYRKRLDVMGVTVLLDVQSG